MHTGFEGAGHWYVHSRALAILIDKRNNNNLGSYVNNKCWERMEHQVLEGNAILPESIGQKINRKRKRVAFF